MQKITTMNETSQQFPYSHIKIYFFTSQCFKKQVTLSTVYMLTVFPSIMQTTIRLIVKERGVHFDYDIYKQFFDNVGCVYITQVLLLAIMIKQNKQIDLSNTQQLFDKENILLLATHLTHFMDSFLKMGIQFTTKIF